MGPTQIEIDAAQAQINMAGTLDRIAESLAVIAKQMAVQNEALLKLTKAPKVEPGMWYMSKPTK